MLQKLYSFINVTDDLSNQPDKIPRIWRHYRVQIIFTAYSHNLLVQFTTMVAGVIVFPVLFVY